MKFTPNVVKGFIKTQERKSAENNAPKNSYKDLKLVRQN